MLVNNLSITKCFNIMLVASICIKYLPLSVEAIWDCAGN